MTTQLLLLGTGTPNYAPGRAQQASAVLIDDQAYLIDAGDGVMLRLAEAAARGIEACAQPRLTRLFLTHLHPDHTAGLPGLIIGPWVQMRREPLQIFGPPGTQALVDGILSGYAGGIRAHRDGLAPIDHPLAVEVTEYDSGTIYADDRVTITAFRVDHGVITAFGLKFVAADRVIVHSGDTRPTATLVKHAQGCDILVHEVYYAPSLTSRPAAWQAYHRAVHTSSAELGAIARAVRPGLLVLNHQLIWGGYTEDDLMAELRAGYDGAVAFGRDLSTF